MSLIIIAINAAFIRWEASLMSKQRLQAARELIQQKKYAEARRILKGMDDPTAIKWLAKLDEIAPEEALTEPHQTNSRSLVVVLGFVASLIIVGAVAFFVGRESMRSQIPQVEYLVVTSTAVPTEVAQVPTYTPTLEITQTSVPSDAELTGTAVIQQAVTQIAQQTESAATLAAVTPTATPEPTRDTKTSAAQIASQPSTGNWEVAVSTDAFTDARTVILSLVADDTVLGWLGDIHLLLGIRCEGNVLDVIVATTGQIEEVGLTDTARARIRFDSNPPSDITMGLSTTGEGMFFDNPEAILRQMLQHNTLTFGYTPFNANFDSTTFDLRGLSEAVTNFSGQCRY